MQKLRGLCTRGAKAPRVQSPKACVTRWPLIQSETLWISGSTWRSARPWVVVRRRPHHHPSSRRRMRGARRLGRRLRRRPQFAQVRREQQARPPPRLLLPRLRLLPEPPPRAAAPATCLCPHPGRRYPLPTLPQPISPVGRSLRRSEAHSKEIQQSNQALLPVREYFRVQSSEQADEVQQSNQARLPVLLRRPRSPSHHLTIR